MSWAPRRLYLSEVKWGLPVGWSRVAKLLPSVAAESAVQLWVVAQNAWRPIEDAGLGPAVTYFGIATLAGSAGLSYSCGIYHGHLSGRTSLAREVASLGYVEPSKLQELAVELALPDAVSGQLNEFERLREEVRRVKEEREALRLSNSQAATGRVGAVSLSEEVRSLGETVVAAPADAETQTLELARLYKAVASAKAEREQLRRDMDQARRTLAEEVAALGELAKPKSVPAAAAGTAAEKTRAAWERDRELGRLQCEVLQAKQEREQLRRDNARLEQLFRGHSVAERSTGAPPGERAKGDRQSISDNSLGSIGSLAVSEPSSPTSPAGLRRRRESALEPVTADSSVDQLEARLQKLAARDPEGLGSMLHGRGQLSPRAS
jgi:hypothetical protein